MTPSRPSGSVERELESPELVTSAREILEDQLQTRSSRAPRHFRASEALSHDERSSEESASLPDSHGDPDGASLDALAGQETAFDGERVTDPSRPQARIRRREEQAEADDHGRRGSERPRRQEGDDPEHAGDGALASHPGGGVPSTASRTTLSTLSPAARASGARSSR